MKPNATVRNLNNRRSYKGFKRKLAAILSADVAGYSRLMSEDEISTVRTLQDYRKTLSDIVNKHNGRIVDSPGDNTIKVLVSTRQRH